jgi:hypothetical protein
LCIVRLASSIRPGNLVLGWWYLWLKGYAWIVEGIG